jgi:trk system potassium uptake protein TrkH
MLNWRFIFRFMGLILIFIGIAMMLCSIVSVIYAEDDFKALVFAGFVTIVFGFAAWFFNRNDLGQMLKHEGFMVVTLVWVLISVFGALPFVMSGYIPSFTDAFFETMSGFTTTGASILVDIEALPHGLLFWRSTTHLLGGMGVIVLAIAVLPYFGFGGMQLYNAEASGISSEKLHPRITQSARVFWGIYLGLVALETIFLLFGQMPLFEALCHSFGTIASGGFSPKNNSIAGYSAYIQYVIIVAMLCGGTNFALWYYMLNRKWDKVKVNNELRVYLGVVIMASLLITLFLIFKNHLPTEKAFRDALFQVTSIVTSTGFITADYMQWHPFTIYLLFVLMFSGASVGSTSGGIKIMRHNILFRNSILEFKRMLHPQAVIPLRIGDKVITSEIVTTVLAFVILYLMIFTASSLVLTMLGVPWDSSMGACATTMGGIGPGLGSMGGPVGNFAAVPVAGKWILSFLMLIGRLELFSVLVLFSPNFWSNR